MKNENKKSEKNVLLDKIKKNKKKKRQRRIIVYIGTIALMIYILYAIYLLLINPTDKVTVEEGTVYQEEVDIGYIIRDEQVVKGENYKNGMEQIIPEGKKAAKNEDIFRYYSKNETELKQQIADLDSKIQEASKSEKNNIPLAEAKQLENQLDEKIKELSKITDMTKIAEYKKQIDSIISKKSKLVGETSETGSYLKQLYNQRAELEKKLNSGAEYVKAPKSGIVSYKVDGLEETLTPSNFSSLGKDFLNKLNLKTGQIVATSDECGKIIDNSYCYIATISNTEEGRNAKVDDTVRVRFSDNKTIKAKIVYVSKENDNENLIILSLDREIEKLANYRKISFDLIWWSNTGFKIPNSAIVEKDGINYVVRNRAGYYDKIAIKVEKKNDKYSIVSNYSLQELNDLNIKQTATIAIYDELILNPDLSNL